MHLFFCRHEDLFVPTGPLTNGLLSRLPGRGRIMHCRGHEEKLEPISQGGHWETGGSTENLNVFMGKYGNIWENTGK